MNHNLFSMRQQKLRINSLLHINAVKSAAEVIKESSLEADFNLDDSFCEAQEDLKQSWRQTKVSDVLITFLSVLIN